MNRSDGRGRKTQQSSADNEARVSQAHCVEGDEKVPARLSSFTASVDNDGEEDDDTAVPESRSLAGSAEADEVRSRAERAAISTSLEPSLPLDDIWQRDIESVDLPEYVRARSTTISFPEKVSRKFVVCL